MRPSCAGHQNDRPNTILDPLIKDVNIIMDQRFENLRTKEDVSILNGLAFEEFLTQLFTNLGYIVEKTPASGDYGVDIILARDDKKSGALRMRVAP